MADAKLTDLTAYTTLLSTDVAYVVADPGGTPLSKKITIANFMAGLGLNGSGVAVGDDSNVIGAVPVLHRIPIVAGANGNTDVVLTHKTRVVDAWLVLTGAGVGSATLQVKNGTNAITNAMAASGSDQALVRAGSIDDAQHEIAAGGTLRVTGAGGTSMPNAIVYVLGERVT